MYSCFWFFEKGELSTHKGLEPFVVESKVQRSTDWVSGSGREECTLFPVVNLNVLSRFFDSYTSAAHCNSSLMTIVYSQFSCFHASSSMKKESSRPTRDSNSWSLNQESNALPTELAGLGERNAHCFLLLIWTFFQFFSTLTILPLIVILSWWRLSTHSFHVSLLLVLWKGRVLDPQGTRTLCRWIKSPTLYRLS